MNKIIKNIALFICVSVVFSSCETIDYGNINDNPNGPTAAVTSQLLTEAQRSVPSILVNETTINYMQHITEGQYPSPSKYNTLTYNYNDWYTGPIQNLNEIIKLNTDPDSAVDAAAFGSNNNQIATSKLLRAYFLQFMTDRWGALPWSEAFQGIDFPQPKFDSQESLYGYMFAEVDEALGLINTSAAGPKGDVMFNGDMNDWKSFGNTLKMTMALRVSDADPATAKSKFEQAASSGTLVTTNADNLLFNYGADNNSASPWYLNFETREDYIASETMIESLRTNLDPRLFKFFEPARDSESAITLFPGGIDKGYVGADDGKVNGNVPDYSFMSSNIIYEKQTPSPIYAAAQVRFSLAEAAGNGWSVSGSASEHYEAGIAASMDYWGVDPADAAAYIAAHPYSGIADIAYEKWVALYLNGPEAWAEWRRLDAPTLIPSAYATDQRIPVRHAYDSSVEDNNKANYDAVVASQGADNLHTKLWWDKN